MSDVPVSIPRRLRPIVLLCAILAAPAGAPPALAQAAGQAAPEKPKEAETVPPPPTLEELARLIEAQKVLIDQLKVLIEEQKARLEQQEKQLNTQSKDLAARTKEAQELRLQIESMTRRLDELQDELPALQMQKAIEERLKRVEAGAQKVPELPPDIVSAGDFPGSIRIPGTDSAIKFGGRLRVATVATLDPLGSGDRFLTNSIPVDGSTSVTDDKQTNINANTSRLNFELRTPTGGAQIRAFIEGDFFGGGNSFRLRHAYGQYHGFLFGQTWSTFSDPAANHEDLDFEGVSSENVVRQPLIRYNWIPKPTFSMAAAIETPKVSVTGGDGQDVIPDLVGRIIWKFKEVGHLQVAGVLREIRAAPTPFTGHYEREPGWGIGVSGVFPFDYFDMTDRFIFQVNGGRGIGRYINDLSSLGGADGVFDPNTGDFEVLPAYGWYADYEHMWKHWQASRDMNLRSSVIWSFVNVQNVSFQPDDSYHQTQRLGFNIIFSPIKRLDVGAEYIWGLRRNKDGETGTARQIQLVVIARF